MYSSHWCLIDKGLFPVFPDANPKMKSLHLPSTGSGSNLNPEIIHLNIYI
jgi:hypothetical protein